MLGFVWHLATIGFVVDFAGQGHAFAAPEVISRKRSSRLSYKSHQVLEQRRCWHLPTSLRQHCLLTILTRLLANKLTAVVESAVCMPRSPASRSRVDVTQSSPELSWKHVSQPISSSTSFDLETPATVQAVFLR